jgi:SAM-dependent methyltransferase
LSSDAARVQEAHYDKIARAYLENLNYPHTQEYAKYIAGALHRVVDPQSLNCMAEICCGPGEAFQLLGNRIARGVGVDISVPMLESALSAHGRMGRTFVQGDATSLPLRSAAFDSVFMLGGIHHVNDRGRLFSEVARILKPGGKFYFREPVDDFLPWRLLRRVIYRWAPALDHETEHPLRRAQTEQTLTAAGLHCTHWSTHGFLGFCLFMNSDVLVFNRLLRFLPGIREITRWAARVDGWTLKLPGLAGAGLQVVGVAEKPRNLARAEKAGLAGLEPVDRKMYGFS